MRLNGEPDFMRSSTPLLRLAKYALLGLVGVCVAFFTGCISREFGNAVATAAVSQAIASPVELSLSVSKFQQATQRWPKDYEELSAFLKHSGDGLQPRQYDRVDFTESSDGSLEVYAVAPGPHESDGADSNGDRPEMTTHGVKPPICADKR